MKTHTGKNGMVVKVSQPNGAPSIGETYWGLIVRRGSAAQDRAALGEIAATLGCVFFGIMAYSNWLLPGRILETEVLPFKIAGTAVFFMFAGFLYLIARRGLHFEAQIDTKRRQFRIVRRNREGAASLVESYPFEEIERVYLVRSKTFTPDRLYVQPRGRSWPIMLAAGRGNVLDPILERMIEAMRGKRVREIGVVTPRRHQMRHRSMPTAFAAR